MTLVEWLVTDTCDDAARGLYMRHYSSWKRPKNATNPRFVGPGEVMVLVTVDYRAVFVWRKSMFRMDGQTGIECTVFRNEGAGLSSSLIRQADAMAFKRWPGERHFTYVDPKAIDSEIPGYCFKRAGWKHIGESKRGLHLLRRNAT